MRRQTTIRTRHRMQHARWLFPQRVAQARVLQRGLPSLLTRALWLSASRLRCERTSPETAARPAVWVPLGSGAGPSRQDLAHSSRAGSSPGRGWGAGAGAMTRAAPCTRKPGHLGAPADAVRRAGAKPAAGADAGLAPQAGLVLITSATRKRRRGACGAPRTLWGYPGTAAPQVFCTRVGAPAPRLSAALVSGVLRQSCNDTTGSEPGCGRLGLGLWPGGSCRCAAALLC